MQLLDGKLAARAIQKSLTQKTEQLLTQGKRTPHLAAILVGNDGASEIYIASKVKMCKQIGFQSSLYKLPEQTTEKELFDLITTLNENVDVDGILVQLPLPPHISTQNIIGHIKETKDVDGFHPINIGKMVQALPSFISATPYGILLLLEHYNIDTKGKHAVVIGRSNIVGRPMSILLSSGIPFGNCTVTLCHRYSTQLKLWCTQADILISAVGRPSLITEDMVKPNAVVVDVGITRVMDPTSTKGYTIKGDVDFEHVAPKTSYITPVPGGVGPMTIAALMKNTWKAYQNRL